ncbi:hypothetical protein SOVF_102480 [Spinacia oleracea]|nr:hypothetical protein SOVF_102480 [Spinacia oleracea]
MSSLLILQLMFLESMYPTLMTNTLQNKVNRRKKKGEGEFFEAEKEEKNVLPAEKKESQKAVDAPLTKNIEAVPELKAYLAASFSLKSGMKPHELIF